MSIHQSCSHTWTTYVSRFSLILLDVPCGYCSIKCFDTKLYFIHIFNAAQVIRNAAIQIFVYAIRQSVLSEVKWNEIIVLFGNAAISVHLFIISVIELAIRMRTILIQFDLYVKGETKYNSTNIMLSKNPNCTYIVCQKCFSDPQFLCYLT